MCIITNINLSFCSTNILNCNIDAHSVAAEISKNTDTEFALYFLLPNYHFHLEDGELSIPAKYFPARRNDGKILVDHNSFEYNLEVFDHAFNKKILFHQLWPQRTWIGCCSHYSQRINVTKAFFIWQNFIKIIIF